MRLHRQSKRWLMILCKVTPANIENLSLVGRWPVSLLEAATIFLTPSEVEAIWKQKKKKENAYVSSIYLVIIPPTTA